jgi:hypothetical protein
MEVQKGGIMRSFNGSLLVVLVIAILGTFMPVLAEAGDCPRVVSTHRVVSATHADGVTTIVYEVTLVNRGSGDLIDGADHEAALILPARATLVDVATLSYEEDFTVVSEGGYDTGLLWDLSLAAGDATVSTVTVTVPDKPIQDGAPIQQGEGDWQSNLFLYVAGACNSAP